MPPGAEFPGVFKITKGFMQLTKKILIYKTLFSIVIKVNGLPVQAGKEKAV